MSELDANLQYYILNIVLPLLFIWFIAKYVFGIRFKNMRLKLEALMFYHLCGRLHARLCAKEKLILFSTLPKLKNKLDVEHLNILEIGVGSGQNFSHYPEGTIITALDPNPSHESYLHKNLKSCNNNVNFQGFIKAYGENMSQISDESFDAVVCTLTLCSVRDSKKVLDEVHRVLRKNGMFYYLEHVAAERGTITRTFQERLQLVWPYFSGGCSLVSETWAQLDESKFDIVDYHHFSAPTRLFFFFKPFLYGTATKIDH